MGSFGGETLKPTVLRSNRAWVRKLRRTANAEDRARFLLHKQTNGENVNRLEDGVCGRKRFGGNGQRLKESQIYPQGYADAVVNVWEAEEKDCRAAAEPIDLCSDSESDFADPPGEGGLWQDLDAERLPFLMNMQPNRLPVEFA